MLPETRRHDPAVDADEGGSGDSVKRLGLGHEDWKVLKSPGRDRARAKMSDSGLVHIKTVNMIKVIITGSESG